VVVTETKPAVTHHSAASTGSADVKPVATARRYRFGSS
jgi:hypothetical protein